MTVKTGTGKLVDEFRAARRVSTPLLQIITADPAAVIDGLNKAAPDDPVLRWDSINGLVGLTPAGKAAIRVLFPDVDFEITGRTDKEKQAARENLERNLRESSVRPTDALVRLQRAPAQTVTYLLNLGLWWGTDADIVQALWNLRDPYKTSHRAAVVIGPESVLPTALQHDVTVLRDPLPDRSELRDIVVAVHENAGLPLPDEKRMNKLIDAVAGLSAFEADQCASMAATKAGLDLAVLRGFRRAAVEATPGLSIHKGNTTRKDYGGGDAAFDFLLAAATGEEEAKVLVIFDEIDKAFGGAGTQGGPGDNTGVTQHQHGAFLKWLEGRKVRGGLFHGIPGSGKTYLLECLAGELDLELIKVDVGMMQSSAVGDSQARTQQALDIIDAVGQGHVMAIATANSSAPLSTELLRRFSVLGEWYFDTCSPAERDQIVGIKLQKYGLTVTADNPLPNMDGWTGAEIDRLCYLSWNLRWPFLKAARFVVPLTVSARERIARIRDEADGKYLSAAHGETFDRHAADQVAAEAPAPATRAIELEDTAREVIENVVARKVLGGMKES